jgi:isopentenyl-diphosphate delta-isomerase
VEEQQVILVDGRDVPIGVMEKMEAHQKGLLHRAFSIFIFNQQGEMLLQQRALTKYHSGGLWTNSCCSHPQPGEDTITSAQKRLQEEMGFTTNLQKIFDFVYRAEFNNGLTEHEFDHIFAGEYEGIAEYNQEEVMACSYKSMEELDNMLQQDPTKFTKWFRLAFPGVKEWWQQHYKKQPA